MRQAVTLRRWRLFGNESQEKDFIVTGGLLWWGDFLVGGELQTPIPPCHAMHCLLIPACHQVIGCYSITSNRDEVRLYPREARLDNAHCSTELVEAQVRGLPPVISVNHL